MFPSSVDNLPAFTTFFPEIFAASQEGKSADEQALALMMMITQLSRFKSSAKNATSAPSKVLSIVREAQSSAEDAAVTVSGGGAAAADTIDVAAVKTAAEDQIDRYLGGSAAQRAIEEVVLWMMTAAARQVIVFL
jgi:hypothetical protein